MSRLASLPLVALVIVVASCRLGSPTAPPDDAEQHVASLAASAPVAGDLTQGDSIVLEIVRAGCFHHFRHRVTLAPDSLGARVAVATLEANVLPESGWGFRSRARIDVSQLARLDALLALYRRQPAHQVCTSSTEVHIAWYRGGRPVRRDHLVDASCREYDEPGVLRIDELVRFERVR